MIPGRSGYGHIVAERARARDREGEIAGFGSRCVRDGEHGLQVVVLDGQLKAHVSAGPCYTVVERAASIVEIDLDGFGRASSSLVQIVVRDRERHRAGHHFAAGRTTGGKRGGALRNREGISGPVVGVAARLPGVSQSDPGAAFGNPHACKRRCSRCVSLRSAGEPDLKRCGSDACRFGQFIFAQVQQAGRGLVVVDHDDLEPVAVPLRVPRRPTPGAVVDFDGKELAVTLVRRVVDDFQIDGGGLLPALDRHGGGDPVVARSHLARRKPGSLERNGNIRCRRIADQRHRDLGLLTLIQRVTRPVGLAGFGPVQIEETLARLRRVIVHYRDEHRLPGIARREIADPIVIGNTMGIFIALDLEHHLELFVGLRD